MTYPARSHARAIFDLLRPLVDLYEYQVFFGEPDVTDADLTYPYIVVWAQSPTSSIVNLTGTLSDRGGFNQITAVGRDSDEVLAALDLADGLLQGVKPVIAGRDPGFLRNEPTGEPVRPNETLRTPEGAPTYRGIALYSLFSGPRPS